MDTSTAETNKFKLLCAKKTIYLKHIFPQKFIICILFVFMINVDSILVLKMYFIVSIVFNFCSINLIFICLTTYLKIIDT